MKITIIGGGVIGLTSAYFLRMNNSSEIKEINIIERNSDIAQESSLSNGGQLSYSHAEPWANPNSIKKVLKNIKQAGKYLCFTKKRDIFLYYWLCRFLFNSLPYNVRRNSKEILTIGLASKKLLAELMQQAPFQEGDFSYKDCGILHIYKTKQELQAAMRQFNYQRDLDCGFDFDYLTQAQIALREPNIKITDVKGGIFCKQDAVADIHLFCHKLKELLLESGVKFHYNTEIEDFAKNGRKLLAAIAGGKEFASDKFVIAGGAYSPFMAKKLRENLGIYPIKGYTLTLPIPKENSHLMPNSSVMENNSKICYTPFARPDGSYSLRMGGMAEFAGYDANFDSEKSIEKIELLKQGVKENFPRLAREVNQEQAVPNACLRSSTPSGLPVIKKAKYYDNCFFNTGQGSLGWTMAIESAQRLQNFFA